MDSSHYCDASAFDAAITAEEVVIFIILKKIKNAGFREYRYANVSLVIGGSVVALKNWKRRRSQLARTSEAAGGNLQASQPSPRLRRFFLSCFLLQCNFVRRVMALAHFWLRSWESSLIAWQDIVDLAISDCARQNIRRLTIP
jgi:hypothetical protein